MHRRVPNRFRVLLSKVLFHAQWRPPVANELARASDGSSSRGGVARPYRAAHHQRAAAHPEIPDGFESGRVRFPREAPWLSGLEAELFSFPNGRHDDQVDSISQALAHELPQDEWTAKHIENFGKFVNGLVMDQFWGHQMGRPW
jgi:hypothetical protein